MVDGFSFKVVNANGWTVTKGAREPSALSLGLVPTLNSYEGRMKPSLVQVCVAPLFFCEPLLALF